MTVAEGMRVEHAQMTYCPQCDKRGLKSPLYKATASSIQFKDDEHIFVFSSGSFTVFCKRRVSRTETCSYTELIELGH